MAFNRASKPYPTGQPTWGELGKQLCGRAPGLTIEFEPKLEVGICLLDAVEHLLLDLWVIGIESNLTKMGANPVFQLLVGGYPSAQEVRRLATGVVACLGGLGAQAEALALSERETRLSSERR